MVKLGDPPAVPTPIDPCPKCKARDGWDYKYSSFGKDQSGHSICRACGAKF